MEVHTKYTVVEDSFQAGQQILAHQSNEYRRQYGQYLTPPQLARFMANRLGSIPNGSRILDPAIGSGTLICAVIENLIARREPREIWVDGYEVDTKLVQVARETLQNAIELAQAHDIKIHVRLIEADFVLDGIDTFWPALLPIDHGPRLHHAYQFIIANPPYFKLNKDDPRARATKGRLPGNTNIYTLFMGLSARLLSPGGQACFIVPRSFCSGAYFGAFRRDFLKHTVPTGVHLFESRQDAFKTDDVLQENVVVSFRHKPDTEQPQSLDISVSRDLSDLAPNQVGNAVSMEHFIGRRGREIIFRLPTSELDERIIDVIDNWQGSLGKFGLEISTGPIVPFRAKDSLVSEQDVHLGRAVPLLWMQNVKPQRVEWPVSNGKRTKSQGFLVNGKESDQLVPAANYVLLRRFSAKEEARRLIAAPFLISDYSYQQVGLENHLNYIYRRQGQFDDAETMGLSALLNSGLIDRYFRISNGNTQVNATELRALPLPSWDSIILIGHQVLKHGNSQSSADLDAIVTQALQQAEILPLDFPVIRETRTSWGK